MKGKTSFWLSVLALCAACHSEVPAPAPLEPCPLPKQVEWQQMEMYAFVHFGLNTFNDREWGYGDSDPATFNPVRLDCEQWVRTFVDAGMKGVILTAKHHDGFCLWPTKLTEYCIRNSPYKDGKGDIVGELAEACRKYGIKFAVYLSPWDRNHAGYGTPEYVEYFYAQLRELLTSYGEVFEVWFDGANGGDGWYGGAREVRSIDRKTYYDFARAHRMVEELQPQAVIFSDGGPGCRWVGNESGFAGATNWSFIRSAEVHPGYERYKELQYGHADGDLWVAAECDVSIRPGWFYHPEEDSKVKTVEQLTDLYYRSVGHNATLLLNFPVDRNGLIHPVDSANAVDFHRRVKSELADNLLLKARLEATNERGDRFEVERVTDGVYDSYWATADSVCTGTVTCSFDSPQKVNRFMIQEYIPLGQRVQAFVLEYESDGNWLPVRCGEETTTVGYKRLLRFEPVETARMRVRFLRSRACLCINEMGAYYAPDAIDCVEEPNDVPESLPFEVVEETSDRLTIDLGGIHTISSFFYLPDQSEYATGLVSAYVLSAGKDLANMQVVAEGEFSNIRNNPIMQYVYFTPAEVRYVSLKAVRMVDGEQKMKYDEVGVR